VVRKETNHLTTHPSLLPPTKSVKRFLKHPRHFTISVSTPYQRRISTVRCFFLCLGVSAYPLRIDLSSTREQKSRRLLPLPAVGEGRGEGERETARIFPLTQILSTPPSPPQADRAKRRPRSIGGEEGRGLLSY